MASKTSGKTQKSRNKLAHYQSMRDFTITEEPRGDGKSAERASRALPFVVQKHAASRLHYDFRLGWNGVLKSWAVTKGPSYSPRDKRLAVMVEDHPWNYRDFEGTIPKGQYGGGTVMVWDSGEWKPNGDVERGLREGHLKFELRGKKLKGHWALVRMNGGREKSERSEKTNWLLIKEKDEFARDDPSGAITDEAPDSAQSGKTMEEIATAADRVWNSSSASRNNGQSSILSAALAKAKPTRKKNARVDGAPRERIPAFLPPQLAQQAAVAPSGSDWLHELKVDGYRIQIRVLNEGNKAAKRVAQLMTRNGLDWTARMPDVAQAARALNVESAILDGEAAALDERGVSSFADLQAAFHEGRQKYITYFAFDLLHLDGHNLRVLPLVDRRAILADLLKGITDSPLRLSEAIEGDGPTVYQQACRLGAEGIVSKLASAAYSAGRGNAWLKIKCRLEQEFVVGGFTLPSKGTAGIGALLLGYFDGQGLRYAGRTGTGFTQATHKLLRGKLDHLTTKECPFFDVPTALRRGVRWVRPELVVQVAFTTWTRDQLVRQAAFKGIREDKPAAEVVRESGQPPASEAKHRPRTTKQTHRSAGKKANESERHQHDGRRDEPRSAGTVPVITHPEKVLDAESGLTKQALADYYIAVAEHLLPHLADRPLSVVRCPDGSGKPCFFQKHVEVGLPEGVKSLAVKNRKSGENEEFVAVDSRAGLRGLAQMGVLEIHPWGSRHESLDKPDRIIFDLDPDASISWKTLAGAAQELRKRLRKNGLESFLKSTGGKGLHVVVPVHPEHEWPEIKEFAHRLVLGMERDHPELYITKMSKAARKNHIYLDYLRNDRGSTAVAPYSPRARGGAPVAMPLKWSELNAPKAPTFHVSDFQQWKQRLRHDPWQNLSAVDQELDLAK